MDIETVYQKYFHEVFLYLRAISGSESIAEELPDELFDPALQILERMIDKEAAKAIKNHMEHLPEPYGIIM